MRTNLLDIRLADCMDVMREFPDGHFDLAIVDPPYGIGNFIPQNMSKTGRSISEKVNWNDSVPPPQYFSEVKRVSRRQIIWGANYYNCFPKIGGAVVWNKGDANPVFSQCEIASLSFQKRVDYIHVNWQSGFHRAAIEDVIHPCQKPVALYRWLLSKYAERGQRILDTHLGSGSSAIACHYARCPLVACEIDPDYYAAACARIERETQMVEFDFESQPRT